MRGEQYLTKSAQYELVYKKGSSRPGSLVVMKALPNGLDLSRYGFSINRRVGGAVVRNRVKRLLREILRETPLRPGWDIILLARSAAAKASYAELKEEVGNLLVRAGLCMGKYEKVGPGTN